MVYSTVLQVSNELILQHGRLGMQVPYDFWF